MAQREPSAAEALFPHLPRGTPDVVQRPERNESVAAAMWPSLVPKPPPPTNPYREILLRNLRELNARMRER